MSSRMNREYIQRSLRGRDVPKVDIYPEDCAFVSKLPTKWVEEEVGGNVWKGSVNHYQLVLFLGRWRKVAKTTLVDDVGVGHYAASREEQGHTVEKLNAKPHFGIRVTDTHFFFITEYSDG